MLFKKKKANKQELALRIFKVNDAEANREHAFLHNRVYTTKYTAFSFLPRFLFDQFSKAANIFFLCMASLQQIPGLSPTNRFSIIVPLSCVIGVSAIKEIYEDHKRRVADETMNNSTTMVLEGDNFVQKKWADVRVGDILLIRNNESFPADLVLLASSEPESLCYIETANIDGETNLKIRQANPKTIRFGDIAALKDLLGVVKCELPNNSIYTFEGTLSLENQEVSLDPSQFLPRGSVLKNTGWVYGAVAYTGHESKLMKNASQTPMKRTRMDKLTNNQIMNLFVVLVGMALISTVAYAYVSVSILPNHYYLRSVGGSLSLAFLKDIVMKFFTFVLLYNNLVPISLIVTMEAVRFWLAGLINSDVEMYDAETDTPAAARTSTLIEELGQVEYILSDKTGTLTCNRMELKHVIVGGKVFTDCTKSSSALTRREQRSPDLEMFMRILSVCHTVVAERDDDGRIHYQASSPDEAAIVKAAAKMNFRFINRRPRALEIEIRGRIVEFQVLAMIEFNSTRKRMSTIIQSPEGKTFIFCKGADTVILERLDQQANDTRKIDETLVALEGFAVEGLRTLCFAYREINATELEDWLKKWEAAINTVNNRQEAIDAAAAEIEKDFIFVGSTGVEDKLQEGVPETISTLLKANIKIWVLTGDRQETAINIGYSCRLLDDRTVQLIVNETSVEATLTALKNVSARMNNLLETGEFANQKVALIIDGKSLGFVLDNQMEDLFLSVAAPCRTLICCRVSPLQKAQVTNLVKERLNKTTLAIGDGANDVGMIQSAHIGVGISGNEGLQAARSADFSIAQFRYLQRLLLVHGAWSCHRLSRVVLYCIYKNIILYVAQFWYAALNMFSGQTLYESWMLSVWNVMFTAMPPLVIGITDQYVSATHLLRNPQLYELGQNNRFYNTRSFWASASNGFFLSLFIFVLCALTFREDLILEGGQTTSIGFFGSTVYILILLTVSYKVAIFTNYFTMLMASTLFLSVATWFLYIPLHSLITSSFGLNSDLYGLARMLYTSPVFWSLLFIVPVATNARDYLWKFYRRQFRPKSYHIVQELQKLAESTKVQGEERIETPKPIVIRADAIEDQRTSRGYSFSQSEGQRKVMEAYSTADQQQ